MEDVAPLVLAGDGPEVLEPVDRALDLVASLVGRVSKGAGSGLWDMFENPVAARMADLRWCPSWTPSRALISLVTMTQGAGWLGSRVGCLWSAHDARAVLS
ncbi:hypothetical protein GCM10010215_65460 [Streptomyces virginiae]|uniref:Uncharacterized protein n=1 Tax=Streptomyces virginiae TaxID=1961 RepID=A0ABQ3NMQ7_STRVG|nr:hypothetical protein GCM10010215_65460 [Streptomyces virginiae]GHI14066.1 hypothetical protein Scinn_35290 [Streptomyces virginiae]